MIHDACFGQSKHLQAPQGLNASQLAKALTRDPRPVASWLAQEPFRPRTPSKRHSKWAPFQLEMVRLLEVYRSSAAPVFQRPARTWL